MGLGARLRRGLRSELTSHVGFNGLAQIAPMAVTLVLTPLLLDRLGLDYIDPDGRATVPGVAPNSLTSTDWRDAYAGTPWHKHVPARIEAVAALSTG